MYALEKHRNSAYKKPADAAQQWNSREQRFHATDFRGHLPPAFYKATDDRYYSGKYPSEVRSAANLHNVREITERVGTTAIPITRELPPEGMQGITVGAITIGNWATDAGLPTNRGKTSAIQEQVTAKFSNG